MTVKELIENLENYGEHLEVFVQPYPLDITAPGKLDAVDDGRSPDDGSVVVILTY